MMSSNQKRTQERRRGNQAGQLQVSLYASDALPPLIPGESERLAGVLLTLTVLQLACRN